MATFNYAGQKWPLPQTGQMWLEQELLASPSTSGFFCLTTSYREEPDPIKGRHDLIFPMFEFEMPGGLQDLKDLEQELLQELGFPDYDIVTYDEACIRYSVPELGHAEEQKLCEDLGSVVFLTHFPERTHPFWNMRIQNGLANKVDIILCGVETIGSAERETDPDKMRGRFYTLSDGEYARILISEFGEKRVRAELEDFLLLPFFPRSGGGIGLTRLVRAMSWKEKK